MKTLKILNWNANGLKKGKIPEFKYFVNRQNFDVIALTETHCVNKQKPPKIRGYKLEYLNRTGRDERVKGGIALYHKIGLGAVPLQPDVGAIENIAIKLPNNLKIMVVYIKQDQLNVNDLEYLLRENKTLITGDFNSRHEDWNNERNNRNGILLKEFIENNPYMLYYPEDYTRYSYNGLSKSTIDLTITNNVNINTIETHEDLQSDHRPITFTLRSQPPEDPQYRILKNFEEANWQLYQRYISDNWTMVRKFNDLEHLEHTIEMLTKNIQEASNRHIPNIQNTNTQSREISEAIRTRNKTRRKFQRTPTQQLRRQLDEENNLVKALIQSHSQNIWEKKIRKAKETKENIWKEIKKIKRPDAMIVPTLKDENNVIYYTSKQKADVIANHLENIQNQPLDNNNAEWTRHIEEYNNARFQQEDNYNNEINITPGKIKKLIQAQRPYKAPGYDGIQIKHLKKLPKKIIVQLFYIYRECIKKEYFPRNWKIAQIIPIQKQNKTATNPKNYRPISLLPILGKLLEKIINENIKTHLEDNNILIDEQFGFRPQHTPELQIARIVDKAKKNFNLNHTTSVLALDLEKAFDVVWHQGLLYKLFQNNVPMNIIKIIKKYLENRTNTVIINQEKSEPFQTTVGIPQGGSLSTTLFLIYINDIPKSQNTELALFADDTAIIASSKNPRLANIRINNHLNELIEYFNQWKININPQKTQLINFNQKQNQDEYQIINIHNEIIETKEKIKYLGVTLDRKLNFKSHINNIKNKANHIINTLYPHLNNTSKLPVNMKIQLYNSYIKPILTYASPVWSSANDTNLKIIQTIENRCLRIIFNKKTYEISNRNLIRMANVTPVLHLIRKKWIRFFRYETNKTPLSQEIGNINPWNAPYRIKHRLINYRMYEHED